MGIDIEFIGNEERPVPGRVALRLVVLAPVAFLVACSGSAEPISVTPAEETSSVVPPSDVTAPALTTAAAYSLSHTWGIQIKSEGYVIVGNLLLGSIGHVTSESVLDGLQAGSQCDVDAQTDGVIPGRFVGKNNTKDFSAYISTNLSPSETAIKVENGAGPDCTLDRGPAYAYTVEPGETVSYPFFVVVSGYYSPTHPRGNQEILQNAQLFLTMLGPKKGFNDLTSLTKSGPWTPNDAIPLKAVAE